MMGPSKISVKLFYAKEAVRYGLRVCFLKGKKATSVKFLKYIEVITWKEATSAKVS